MLPKILLAAVMFSTNAASSEPKLIAVLRINAPTLDKGRMLPLEEAIRTVAGDALSHSGYVILTEENTLQIIEDNGIDPEKVCDASCALAAARNLKASFFISGFATKAQGRYDVFVRMYDGKLGRQLAAIELEGVTVKALQDQFKVDGRRLFQVLDEPEPPIPVLVVVKPQEPPEKVNLNLRENYQPVGAIQTPSRPVDWCPIVHGTLTTTLVLSGAGILTGVVMMIADNPAGENRIIEKGTVANAGGWTAGMSTIALVITPILMIAAKGPCP